MASDDSAVARLPSASCARGVSGAAQLVCSPRLSIALQGLPKCSRTPIAEPRQLAAESHLDRVVYRSPQRHEVAGTQAHAGVARPRNRKPLHLRRKRAGGTEGGAAHGGRIGNEKFARVQKRGRAAGPARPGRRAAPRGSPSSSNTPPPARRAGGRRQPGRNPGPGQPPSPPTGRRAPRAAGRTPTARRCASARRAGKQLPMPIGQTRLPSWRSPLRGASCQRSRGPSWPAPRARRR